MAQFLKYPSATEVPSRKSRKSRRKAIFEANKVAYRTARKARREARKTT